LLLVAATVAILMIPPQWGSPRYLLPLLPVACLFGGCGMLSRFCKRRTRRAGVPPDAQCVCNVLGLPRACQVGGGRGPPPFSPALVEYVQTLRYPLSSRFTDFLAVFSKQEAAGSGPWQTFFLKKKKIRVADFALKFYTLFESSIASFRGGDHHWRLRLALCPSRQWRDHLLSSQQH